MSQQLLPEETATRRGVPPVGPCGLSNAAFLSREPLPRRLARLSDAELIARIAQKDAGALAELYRRYARSVYSLLYNSLMRDPEFAEDLVQDTFIEVWRTAANYRPERGRVPAWIFAIARNRGVDRLRRLSADRRAWERIGYSVPGSQPDEAFELAWKELLGRQVRDVLRTLPPEQLQVLQLFSFSGLTHREIARQLGLPLGTVKGRVRLGLKKLSERLKDRERPVE
ncbi:RNA polymerase sigma factor [Rubrobacter radiotolerans]|uniref:RNA polymerase sigma factor n=1 Tax=Rubrobacter radiotolerans TaxID=42256 RepID=A0AB35T6P7_RUBRA|nr:sigma-70 family RNA polymerase sigma factor [Rubrobacter radiotolerans]MDX5895360.1 sigma-70 family RNA polymerase sigma factor [Rubrobacter radiotolerans]